MPDVIPGELQLLACPPLSVSLCSSWYRDTNHGGSVRSLAAVRLPSRTVTAGRFQGLPVPPKLVGISKAIFATDHQTARVGQDVDVDIAPCAAIGCVAPGFGGDTRAATFRSQRAQVTGGWPAKHNGTARKRGTVQGLRLGCDFPLGTVMAVGEFDFGG